MATGRRSGAVRLLERLNELGWKQLEFSKKIEASPGVVSRWLAGQRKPSLEMAFRIQTAIGLPADAWLDDPLPDADDTGEHAAIPAASSSGPKLESAAATGTDGS